MDKRLDSGTESVSANSDWHYSLGEAENECRHRIDRRIRDTISRLESRGKRIVGSTSYSINSDERERNGVLEYRCSAQTDINWIDRD